MTNQAEPGRPPAHDLSAFDLTKRSPEQLAQSFARWKAQRKRPPEAEATPADPPIPAQPSQAIGEDTAPDPSLGHVAPKLALSKRASQVEYSATFSALLAAGSEPTVQRAVWATITAPPSPKRNGSPGRRLRAMSILAGAASVLALAGGALLEVSDWQDSTEAEPEVAQIRPQQIPMASQIAAAATRAPAVEWRLQRTVDLALMVPDADAAKATQPTPEPPMVRTASKAAMTAPPRPAAKKAAPEIEQFVAKPFVPSAAPSPAVVPAAQKTAVIPAPPVATAIRSGDPRPDALYQYSRDKSTGTSGNGTLNNGVASGGKPAAETGSGSAVDTRSATTRTATARSGNVTNGSSGDPRGEVSGGASVGPDTTSASGGDASDASGGSDAGDGTTGDGSASSGAGGDTGSADTGGSDADGSDTGDSNTGGDGTGGDDAGTGAPSDGGSGDGDSGSSDGEDGDSSGTGGPISGALGGVGDALGDALGGGENKADSEDKDQKD